MTTPLLKDIISLREEGTRIRGNFPCDSLSSYKYVQLMGLFRRIWGNKELLDQIHFGTDKDNGL